MICFFDTSALIKKYIKENGSKKVTELFDIAEDIIVSSITLIETHSTIKRLLEDKIINLKDYELLVKNLSYDFKYFCILNFDQEIERIAINLIKKYQLKSLDAIQLASCLINKKEKEYYFIVCDDKLIKSGFEEKLNIINPNSK